MIQLRGRSLKLDGNGRGAPIILLIIYIACYTVGCICPFSVPPASYVGTPSSQFGDLTLVEKPVDIVRITEGQIPVGATQTHIYRLSIDHIYHIHLLGDWADPLEHKTDYNIIV